MASLRGLVKKWGNRGTARLFSQHGTPHSESSIRSALRNPKGKGYAKLNTDAHGIDIRRRPPPESEVSSTSPRGGSQPKAVKVMFGRREGLQIGRQDTTDKKGNVRRYANLSKRATDNLILAALEKFGPDTVWAVAFYGSVYATVGKGSDVSIAIHRRWITVTVPGNVVYTQATQITTLLETERADIARFVTDPKDRAIRRREVVADYPRRLAEALTKYQWVSVQAMWIAPAKTFGGTGGTTEQATE